jgi:hypothetical protein
VGSSPSPRSFCIGVFGLFWIRTQPPCVSTLGLFYTHTKNTHKMLQALKRTMNTIEEKFNGMMTPDPLQRQEGGEHYKGMKIQPVEFVHANNIPYLEGCAIKYLCRHKAKGGVVDLLKAKHYIDLIISLEYKNQQP